MLFITTFTISTPSAVSGVGWSVGGAAVGMGVGVGLPETVIGWLGSLDDVGAWVVASVGTSDKAE